MILLLATLLGCSTQPMDPITEIGNPERTVGTFAVSSLPAWIDTTPAGVQQVEHAWLALTGAAYLDADCGVVLDSPEWTPTVLDLADASTAIVLQGASDDTCGVRLGVQPLAELPQGVPDVVAGASVVLEGLDALDRPFVLRSTVAHESLVQRPATSSEPVFRDGAVIVADLLMWTAMINIAAFPADDDGVVRIDDLPTFDDNIPGAFRITYDYDSNGTIDDWEIDSGSSAQADPPLADADQDGLPDVNERVLHTTNPQDIDTDDDNLGDGPEVLQHGTDPTRVDSDDDGVRDGVEVFAGTDPLDSGSF